MTDTTHWTDALVRLKACPEAVEWARTQPDLAAAWATCERGDWMLWLAGKCAGEPWSEARKPLVRAACVCARLALPIYEQRYPEDRRPHAAIETAEAWTRGEATPEQVRAAYAAAAAFADAAAAYAAAAAFADAAAAYAAAAYADAAYAERSRVLRECTDLVRREYPTPPEITR